MKRKLATVTPDIYNGLDLIVDSPEFNQVRHELVQPGACCARFSCLAMEDHLPRATTRGQRLGDHVVQGAQLWLLCAEMAWPVEAGLVDCSDTSRCAEWSLDVPYLV